MDSSARRVKAERDRRRLPRRSGASRWTLRAACLLATAAFLGVGVASALMIAPDGGGAPTTAGAAATTTPAPTPKPKKKVRHKPKGPTKAQLAQRQAAVAAVRSQGYTTLRLGDYDFKATLRVLIARPVGDAAGGSYAFFFLKGAFLGKDSTSPSTKLEVAKSTKTMVTLAYETSAGRTKVRFKLEGQTFQPLDPIPLPAARLTPRGN